MTLLAAALVGLLALTGCSQSLRAGDAVTVGDTTVSSGRVDDLLADYLAETDQTGADSATISQVRQALLTNIVVNELTSIAAKKLDVSVPAGQVSEQTQAQLEAGNFADVAKQYVIPRALLPDMIRASLERAAIGEKLAGGSGGDAQKSQTSMSQYLVKVAKQENVWVNPLYGQWDPSKLWVSGSGSLVKTGGSVASGS